MIAHSHCLKFSQKIQIDRKIQRLIPERGIDCARSTTALALLLLASTIGWTQDKQTTSEQSPKTAPSTAQILSSYEGQNVVSVEIAGHPELNTSQFASAFVQKAGKPFSTDEVDKTAAALKATGKFSEVQIQVDPESNGVRVLFILEPAI